MLRSFESGDAEITNYNSIPVLTQTLETALSKMLTANINQASSGQQVLYFLQVCELVQFITS